MHDEVIRTKKSKRTEKTAPSSRNQKAARQLPQHTTDKKPQQTTDKKPQQTTDKKPQKTSFKLPQKSSDKLPQNSSANQARLKFHADTTKTLSGKYCALHLSVDVSIILFCAVTTVTDAHKQRQHVMCCSRQPGGRKRHSQISGRSIRPQMVRAEKRWNATKEARASSCRYP